MYLNKVNVLEGQSFLDIAIQACGSVEAAFELAVLNSMSLTDDLVPGVELVLPAVVNSSIALYYKSKNIKPATASVFSTVGGVEYWAIETEFLVS